jgi:hypothetical protein
MGTGLDFGGGEAFQWWAKTRTSGQRKVVIPLVTVQGPGTPPSYIALMLGEGTRSEYSAQLSA